MPPELPDIDAAVAEFEQKLERVRVLYEQYFLGIQKRAPSVLLKDVARLQYLLDQQQIRNTSVRFRYRNLLQKLSTYRAYWGRTMRAMEAGTYHRDVARTKRHLASRGLQLPDDIGIRSPADLERALASALSRPVETPAVTGDPAVAAAAATERPPPAATPAPPAAGPPPAAHADLDEQHLQSLFRRFQRAKEACGQDPSTVRYDALVRSVRQQLPQLRERHPGREIEFQVVVREGKVVLRATAK
ncbi:MAG: hypothetical protein IPG96_06715 [Proteobacteria bacterium]|nr:hypothetical protein [Pseudomonadota bacterium]